MLQMLVLVEDVAILVANNHPQHQRQQHELPEDLSDHRLKFALQACAFLRLHHLFRGQLLQPGSKVFDKVCELMELYALYYIKYLGLTMNALDMTDVLKQV